MVEWRGAGTCKVVAGEMGAGIRARSAPLQRAAVLRRCARPALVREWLQHNQDNAGIMLKTRQLRIGPLRAFGFVKVVQPL